MRRLVLIPALMFLVAACPQTLLVADGGTDVEPYDGGGGTGGGGGSGDVRDAGADAGGGVDSGTRIGPFIWFDLTPSLPRPAATAVDGRGKNDVYVAYQNALIDRWDGRGWTALSAQTGQTVESLVAVADGGVLAGGGQNLVRCLDDGSCATASLGGMVRGICRGPNAIYLATTESYSNNESILWRLMASGWIRLGSTQGRAGFSGCAVTPDGAAAYVAGNPFVYGGALAGGAFVAEPSSNINRTWHAVWVTGTTVYAVADGKHVGTRPLGGTAQDWKDVFDGSGGGPLVAVEAAPSGLPVFAGGDLDDSPGQIAVYDEGSWALHALPEPVDVNDVYVVSASELYVVGGRIGSGAARVYFGVFAP